MAEPLEASEPRPCSETGEPELSVLGSEASPRCGDSPGRSGPQCPAAPAPGGQGRGARHDAGMGGGRREQADVSVGLLSLWRTENMFEAISKELLMAALAVLSALLTGQVAPTGCPERGLLCTRRAAAGLAAGAREQHSTDGSKPPSSGSPLACSLFLCLLAITFLIFPLFLPFL